MGYSGYWVIGFNSTDSSNSLNPELIIIGHEGLQFPQKWKISWPFYF